MINFGIVGIGRIGKIHLSNIQRFCPDAQIVAACPVKGEHKAFLKENGVALYLDTFEEMLQVPKLDAVIIASPTAFHYEHILQAAQAGKHIFCEKPIDLDYEKVKNVAEVGAKA